ncbi:hypothetical protein [Reyranella sp.]
MFAASEARAAGRGGIAMVSHLTGIAHLSQLDLGIIDFEGDEKQKSERFQ